MNKDQVIAILRQHEAELRRRGVAHAALFGSVARGEADEKSDIDIAIDLDSQTTTKMDVFDYMGLQRFIGELFPIPVDVVERQAMYPRVAREMEKEIINAF
jgi:predicted nucleotidyltransferase